MKIIVTAPTILKAAPVQSGLLRDRGLPDLLYQVPEGLEAEIDDYHPYDGDKSTTNDDHIYFQLKEPLPNSQAIRWFAFAQHVQVEGTEDGNDPKDTPEPKPQNPPENFGRKIMLPGISRPVGIYEPIYFEPGPSHFTWSEMTKSGSRIPVSPSITGNIVKLAKYLDGVRDFLGGYPMIITSGYRDPITNRRVGGASRSRHLVGDAADFYLPGMSVVETFNRLKSYHRTGGLAVGNGFVHLDLRPEKARWLYPGGPQVSLW